MLFLPLPISTNVLFSIIFNKLSKLIFKIKNYPNVVLMLETDQKNCFH